MGYQVQVMEVVACTHKTCKAIAISMASSLYLQCAEGSVDPDWKVVSASGPRFQQKMSLQMVQYRSSNLHYPGNAKIQKATQINKKKRGIDEEALVECVCVFLASGYRWGTL
jgi:hypothetical protein